MKDKEMLRQIKKGNKIIDSNSGKATDLEEYFKSNPSSVRLKQSFDLKCRECGSSFISLGINWAIIRKFPRWFGRKRINACPGLACMNCGNKAEAIYLTFKKGKIVMANEQKIY